MSTPATTDLEAGRPEKLTLAVSAALSLPCCGSERQWVAMPTHTCASKLSESRHPKLHTACEGWGVGGGLETPEGGELDNVKAGWRKEGGVGLRLHAETSHHPKFPASSTSQASHSLPKIIRFNPCARKPTGLGQNKLGHRNPHQTNA